MIGIIMRMEEEFHTAEGTSSYDRPKEIFLSVGDTVEIVSEPVCLQDRKTIVVVSEKSGGDLHFLDIETLEQLCARAWRIDDITRPEEANERVNREIDEQVSMIVEEALRKKGMEVLRATEELLHPTSNQGKEQEDEG